MRRSVHFFLLLFLLTSVFSACRSRSDQTSASLREEVRPACSNWQTSPSLAQSCRNPFVVTADPSELGLKEMECGYYMRLRLCLTDCDEGEKNRLLGYYQTCAGVTGLASGDYAFVKGCDSNAQFKAYTLKMRRCLQESSVRFNANACHSCAQVIEGAGGSFDGIIGSHTPCNAVAGFCDLSPESLRCFGAGLGSSWQGVAGNHSVLGSARSVGFCHLLSQAASCASTGESTGQPGYQGFMTFWRSLCSGYQAGCIAMQSNTGTTAGNAVDGIFGGGGATVDKLGCKAACPMPEDLNKLTVVGGNVGGYLFEKMVSSMGRSGVLGAEETCRSFIGTN
ncbi:MAG: hypothetical protein RIQ81_675 [Pseudomonadota bacterium]|jgi:hypothetical protein